MALENRIFYAAQWEIHGLQLTSIMCVHFFQYMYKFGVCVYVYQLSICIIQASFEQEM